MSTRTPSFTMRILCAASVMALTAGMPIAAQALDEENAYSMWLLTQTFDGQEEYSLAQKAALSRTRRGARSYVELDFGDGAVVQETEGGTAASEFKNTQPAEFSFEYNYDTDTMGGTNQIADYHNVYVKPLLRKGPKVGKDASWSVDVTTHQLGFLGLEDQPVTIKLERDYFRHDGQDYVAIRYDIPAFNYTSVQGQAIIQWGRGLVLTDTSFGEVYWTGSLHRASAKQALGGMRPYRFARTIRTFDKNGVPRVNIMAMPEIADIARSIAGSPISEVIPFTRTVYEPDDTPFKLAGYLDMMAQSIGEDSANQSGELSGQVNLPFGGQYAIDATLDDPVDYALDVLKSTRKRLKERKLLDKAIDVSKSIDKALESTAIIFDKMDDSKKIINSTTVKIAQNISGLEKLQTKYFQLVKNADNYDALFNNPEIFKTMRQIEDAQKRIPALQSVLSKERNALKFYTSFAEKVGDFQKTALDVKRLIDANPIVAGTVQFGSNLKKSMDVVLKSPKVDKFFNAASFAFTMEKALKTGNRVGTLDFENNGANPQLSLDYSSTSGLASDLGWAMFSAAADAMDVRDKGGVVRAAKLGFGVMTFASGVASDYYILWEGKKYDDLKNEEAKLLLKQTRLKQVKQWAEIADKDLRALLSSGKWQPFQRFDPSLTPEEILDEYFEKQPDGSYKQIKKYDPYEKGYNLQDDIRVDPDTGLPSPGFWAWLKQNDRAKLARDFGIDPDAPVGTPPGTNWRKDDSSAAGNTKKPSSDPGERNYPEYDPDKDPNGQKDDGAVAEKEDGSSDSDDPAFTNPSDVVLNDDEFWENIDDILDLFDPPSGGGGGAAASKSYPPSPWYSPPGSTSPIVLSELKTSKFDIDPVVFRPPTWKPPKWKPPKWVPPDFDGPDASKIPLRSFGGDSSWPQGSDWLAFDYFGLDDDSEDSKRGLLKGKVETDLSKWDEWLATQDRRKLERLAIQAGYPNLASALNDARNLIRLADDPGFRRWANNQPACGGYIGCGPPGALQGLWTQKRSQLALGDILGDSRDVFSTAGLSDIAISGRTLTYFLSDFGVEDGDIVDVSVTQFGRRLFNQRVNLTNIGIRLDQSLRPGVATVNITAVNEGAISPNTAAINLLNVSDGDDAQTYSLLTGDQAILRVNVGGPGS